MRRQPHPQSPVQTARNRWWAPFLLAFIAALAFWTWQQWQLQPDPPQEPKAAADRAEEPGTPVMDHAKANLAALFSTDDYPMAAIRNEEQGTAAFKLTIDRQGRVSKCEITSSSGSDVLDDATCNIVTKRARFVPARDSNGESVPDEYSGRIRWELPED